VGAAQQANASAMETPLEGEDAKLWRSRCLVLQDRVKLFSIEINSTTPLIVHVSHEHHLDPVLIAAGAAHHGEHLGHARWGHSHHGVFNPVDPVFGWKPSKSRPVGHGLDVALISESFQDGWMVISQWDGGNLHEAVEEGVSVNITEVVSIGLFIVSKKCHSGHLLHGVEVLLEGNRFWARDWGSDCD